MKTSSLSLFNLVYKLFLLPFPLRKKKKNPTSSHHPFLLGLVDR